MSNIKAFIPEPNHKESMHNNNHLASLIGMNIVQYENTMYGILGKMEGYNGGSYQWTRVGEFVYLLSFDDSEFVTASANYIEAELSLSYATLYANLVMCSHFAFACHEKGHEALTGYFSNAFHKLRNVVLDHLDENPDDEMLSTVFRLID